MLVRQTRIRPSCAGILAVSNPHYTVLCGSGARDSKAHHSRVLSGPQNPPQHPASQPFPAPSDH